MPTNQNLEGVLTIQVRHHFQLLLDDLPAIYDRAAAMVGSDIDLKHMANRARNATRDAGSFWAGIACWIGRTKSEAYYSLTSDDGGVAFLPTGGAGTAWAAGTA